MYNYKKNSKLLHIYILLGITKIKIFTVKLYYTLALVLHRSIHHGKTELLKPNQTKIVKIF